METTIPQLNAEALECAAREIGIEIPDDLKRTMVHLTSCGVCRSLATPQTQAAFMLQAMAGQAEFPCKAGEALFRESRESFNKFMSAFMKSAPVQRAIQAAVQNKAAADEGQAAARRAETLLWLNEQCPGCDVEITTDNAGGYRTFCETCVAAFPEFPKDGRGHLIEGRYPNFHWT